MDYMAYAGQFRKFQFSFVRSDIVKVLGELAVNICIDRVVFNFIKAVEENLGNGWYLGHTYFGYPNRMHPDDIFKELEAQFNETDLDAVIRKYRRY